MRHTRFVVGVALSALLLSVPTLAEERCSVELLLGGALNASTTLAINQDGEDDIEIDADYATKPFEFPVYYALRLAHLRARGAWELQFIHHKIHLENTTEEVERFEITDGFNILTVNRAFPAGPVDLRVGAGVVIAHADSRIRGLSTSGGGIESSSRTPRELAKPRARSYSNPWRPPRSTVHVVAEFLVTRRRTLAVRISLRSRLIDSLLVRDRTRSAKRK